MKVNLNEYIEMGMSINDALNTAMYNYAAYSCQPFKIAMSKDTSDKITASLNVIWVKLDNEPLEGKIGYYSGVEIEYDDNLEDGVVEFKRIMEVINE